MKTFSNCNSQWDLVLFVFANSQNLMLLFQIRSFNNQLTFIQQVGLAESCEVKLSVNIYIVSPEKKLRLLTWFIMLPLFKSLLYWLRIVLLFAGKREKIKIKDSLIICWTRNKIKVKLLMLIAIFKFIHILKFFQVMYTVSFQTAFQDFGFALAVMIRSDVSCQKENICRGTINVGSSSEVRCSLWLPNYLYSLVLHVALPPFLRNYIWT